jgi:O-acetyl-ADP-ribose deacetylase (regulator of RNase III)
MITYKKGDLLQDNNKIIAHGCNSFGVMGAGVALAIRNKYPWAFEQYKKAIDTWPHNRKELLGLCNIATDKDITCYNLITQENVGSVGRYVSYDAVDMTFKRMREHMYISEARSLSIPKIGAGLGGGDWSVIEAIINSNMTSIDVTVWEL